MRPLDWLRLAGCAGPERDDLRGPHSGETWRASHVKAAGQCARSWGGVKDWGGATLTAKSDGTSDPKNSDSSSRALFDTAGNRIPDGTFNLGYNDGGWTCS